PVPAGRAGSGSGSASPFGKGDVGGVRGGLRHGDPPYPERSFHRIGREKIARWHAAAHSSVVTGGRSGSRRSSSPHATAQRFLLPRPYFGGFGKPALDRAAVKADVTELAVVEAAEQRKAGLARALFNESRYRAIDDAAGARKEICDCRSDRARSRSIASSMIQQRHGGHPSR